MNLEEMSVFFNVRAGEYDTQQIKNINKSAGCYQEIVNYIPDHVKNLIDLGCGTGLELKEIYSRFPDLKITGIDMSEEMLKVLKTKYPDKELTLINDSYFDYNFGMGLFDAALSVMTLHHFSHEEKIGLYTKVCRCLTPEGIYIECDYMAPNQEFEDYHYAENNRIRKESGITKSFYHYDTPCTVENQIQMLLAAGFSKVSEVWRIDTTIILVAEK